MAYWILQGVLHVVEMPKKTVTHTWSVLRRVSMLVYLFFARVLFNEQNGPPWTACRRLGYIYVQIDCRVVASFGRDPCN